VKAGNILRTCVNKHGLQVLAGLLSFVHMPRFGECCCVLIFFFNEEVASKLAVCTPAICHRHVWDQLKCGNAFLPSGATSRIS